MKKREEYVHSVNLNSQSNFPYLVLEVIDDQSYPRNPGFQVMHWHEDLQFILVLQGSITIQTLSSTISIKEGQAVFINTKVLHHVKQEGHCHYYSFLFPAYFLQFYTETKAFVRPILENDGISLVPFDPSIPWQKEILSCLWQLKELEEQKTDFYCYEVLVKLSTIWLHLIKHLNLPVEQKKDPEQQRMQIMLHYIENHYMDDLSLEALSASAHISKSECARCFRRCLNTTPIKYLHEYRLSKAADYLINTNMSMGDIALKLGYSSPSYFGYFFKKETGLSPKDYRKQHRTS